MSASTSRRAAMLGAVAAAAGGFAVPAVATAGGEDPVIALYRRHLAFEGQMAPLSARHDKWRASMIARFGEVAGADEAIAAAWDADPDRPAMDEISHRLDELVEQQCDVTDELFRTAPTTLEGLRIKVRLLAEYACDMDEMDDVEIRPVLVLNDALRLMGEATI